MHEPIRCDLCKQHMRRSTQAPKQRLMPSLSPACPQPIPQPNPSLCLACPYIFNPRPPPQMSSHRLLPECKDDLDGADRPSYFRASEDRVSALTWRHHSLQSRALVLTLCPRSPPVARGAAGAGRMAAPPTEGGSCLWPAPHLKHPRTHAPTLPDNRLALCLTSLHAVFLLCSP